MSGGQVGGLGSRDAGNSASRRCPERCATADSVASREARVCESSGLPYVRSACGTRTPPAGFPVDEQSDYACCSPPGAQSSTRIGADADETCATRPGHRRRAADHIDALRDASHPTVPSPHFRSDCCRTPRVTSDLPARPSSMLCANAAHRLSSHLNGHPTPPLLGPCMLLHQASPAHVNRQAGLARDSGHRPRCPQRAPARPSATSAGSRKRRNRRQPRLPSVTRARSRPGTSWPQCAPRRRLRKRQ